VLLPVFLLENLCRMLGHLINWIHTRGHLDAQMLMSKFRRDFLRYEGEGGINTNG
jgi:hypothetical protein